MHMHGEARPQRRSGDGLHGQQPRTVRPQLGRWDWMGRATAVAAYTLHARAAVHGCVPPADADDTTELACGCAGCDVRCLLMDSACFAICVGAGER